MNLDTRVWKGGIIFALLSVFAVPFFDGGTEITAGKAAVPTFYKDVLPLLQHHCQSCHRPGEIAPFPLITYNETRRWAGLIREAVQQKKMPPWFADPHFGHFSNDPSLATQEIETL
jgi:hypothetical protein